MIALNQRIIIPDLGTIYFSLPARFAGKILEYKWHVALVRNAMISVSVERNEGGERMQIENVKIAWRN